MTRRYCSYLWLVSFLAVCPGSALWSQTQCSEGKSVWHFQRGPLATTWKDREGRVYPLGVLKDRLRKHRAWLHGMVLETVPQMPVEKDVCLRQTKTKDEVRLDLRGAILSNIDLRGEDLRCANLEGATFTEANLAEADLSFSNLRRAQFMGSNLTEAHLVGADLADSKASNASFASAWLNAANLCGATVRGGDLTHVQLTHSCLLETTLSGPLQNASLEGAVLGMPEDGGGDFGVRESGPSANGSILAACRRLCADEARGHGVLDNAVLSDTLFMRTMAEGVSLRNTNLRRANLSQGAFDNARFDGACLVDIQAPGASFGRAHLEKVNLEGAVLEGADLGDSIYEPSSGTSPRRMALVRNLAHLSYERSLEPLFALQKDLEQAGFATAARDVRAALSRRQAGLIDRCVWGWTCDYRSAPFRPIEWLLAVALISWSAYIVSCFTQGAAGLYLVEYLEPYAIREGAAEKRIIRVVRREVSMKRLILCALFFSAKCTLSFGPRGLGVLSQLVALLPRRDVDVVAFGWPRMFGGFQTLLGTCFLVLALASIPWP